MTSECKVTWEPWAVLIGLCVSAVGYYWLFRLFAK